MFWPYPGVCGWGGLRCVVKIGLICHIFTPLAQPAPIGYQLLCNHLWGAPALRTFHRLEKTIPTAIKWQETFRWHMAVLGS